MATISGGDKITKVLERIGNSARGLVSAGFLSGARYEDGTPVASVAFWQEYGTAHIPARPAIRTTISDKSPDWVDTLGRALTHYEMDGNAALNATGVKMAEDFQQAIVNWSEPPNAESTIRQKGFNNPLIDDGTLQRTPDYEVSNGS